MSLTAAISHALDDRVEPGDVAAARQNADAFSHHFHPLGLHVVITPASRRGFHKAVPWPSASGGAKPRKAGKGWTSFIADQADPSAVQMERQRHLGPNIAHDVCRSRI